nr:outer membrane lipoprotein-sorting protein [uncultured Carboxylicivirga sp.]
MKKMNKILLFINVICWLSGSVYANDNEARTLFESSRQKLVLNNIRMSVDLLTTNGKGQSKSKQLDVVYGKFNDLKKVMVEFTGPEKVKGTKILATDYPDKRGLIEIYMPATGKVQKIRANQHNMRIMDSEIPIEQFRAMVTSELCFTMLEKDNYQGVACQKIKIENSNDTDYEIIYISSDDKLILHIDKYDKRNELLIETEFADYKKIENSSKTFYYPEEIKVKNLKSGKSSELKVRDMAVLNHVEPGDFVIQSEQTL